MRNARRSGSKNGSGRWSHWNDIGWVHYPEIGWSHSNEIRWVQSLEILHIDLDEAKGLIPAHLTLQRELNEYEESNNLEATAWLFARRRGDPLDERFIHVVHGRMFNQTWKWAGKSRRTDKNIGVSWFEIPVRLRQMLGDVRAQIEYQAYSPVEIAARYHHRLVAIHVFPNGNGRHARLMADLLLTELAGQRFEWGRGSLMAANELRARYIVALQAADAGNCKPLLVFLENT